MTVSVIAHKHSSSESTTEVSQLLGIHSIVVKWRTNEQLNYVNEQLTVPWWWSFMFGHNIAALIVSVC